MSLYYKQNIFTKDEIWTLINIYFAKRTGHIETIDNLWQVNFVEIQEDIPLLHKLNVPNYEVYRHYFIGYKGLSFFKFTQPIFRIKNRSIFRNFKI